MVLRSNVASEADLLNAETVGRHADVVQSLGNHPDGVVDQDVIQLDGKLKRYQSNRTSW